MRIFLSSLVFAAASNLFALPVVVGNRTSSNQVGSCAGGGTAALADCQMQVGSNAVMTTGNLEFSARAVAGNNGYGWSNELRTFAWNGGSSTGVGGTDFIWGNGTSYNFTMTFNSSTNVLTYSVNGVTITSNVGPGSANDLFIRTSAEASGAQVSVGNLTINGVNMGTAGSMASNSMANQQLNYLWITGIAGAAQVSVSGRMTMSWTGATPTGSQTGVQFQFGNQNAGSWWQADAPEPGSVSMAAFGIALLAFGVYRKGSKKNQ